MDMDCLPDVLTGKLVNDGIIVIWLWPTAWTRNFCSYYLLQTYSLLGERDGVGKVTTLNRILSIINSDI
jgi:hypothetical protein